MIAIRNKPVSFKGKPNFASQSTQEQGSLSPGSVHLAPIDRRCGQPAETEVVDGTEMSSTVPDMERCIEYVRLFQSKNKNKK